MTENEERLVKIKPEHRILLLPHCLRRTDTCQNKYTKQGLECQECNPDCPVNQLRAAALKLNYKGICIAPGGALALKYISLVKPEAIVAVACDKELQEGIEGVARLAPAAKKAIPIVVVPLSKDGCIDTEVDVELALQKISLGCPAPVSGS